MHWERSASPFGMGSTLKDSDMFDLSSTLENDYEDPDDGDMEGEEESSEVAKNDMECDEPLFGSCDVSPEMLKPFPWKNPTVNFLTMGYFSQQLGCTYQDSSSNSASPNCPDYDFESSDDYFSFRFEIIEAFGVGSFSNVFKVSDKVDHKQYAVKRSKKSFSGLVDRERKLHEVQNLWLVKNSSHCIQLEMAWEQNGFLFIQTEICENGRYSGISFIRVCLVD
jgi:hypothetical protein